MFEHYQADVWLAGWQIHPRNLFGRLLETSRRYLHSHRPEFFCRYNRESICTYFRTEYGVDEENQRFLHVIRSPAVGGANLDTARDFSLLLLLFLAGYIRKRNTNWGNDTTYFHIVNAK